MDKVLSEEQLAFLMRDKRYWHPRHADPAYQAMITEGFRRLYPSPNQAAGGPVHVDAHRRDGSAVREHYRSLPGQDSAGGTTAANDRRRERKPLPPPDRDDITPEELYEIVDFDPNGPGEYENVLGSPLRALRVKEIADKASQVAKAKYPNSRGWNDEADAYRHALWSYEMTREFGPVTAKDFGDGHERTGANKPSETAMDLYNNQVGRDLAQDTSNAGRSSLDVIGEAARNGKLRTRPYPFPAGANQEVSYSYGHPGSRHLR